MGVETNGAGAGDIDGDAAPWSVWMRTFSLSITSLRIEMVDVPDDGDGERAGALKDVGGSEKTGERAGGNEMTGDRAGGNDMTGEGGETTATAPPQEPPRPPVPGAVQSQSFSRKPFAHGGPEKKKSAPSGSPQ